MIVQTIKPQIAIHLLYESSRGHALEEIYVKQIWPKFLFESMNRFVRDQTF